MLWLAPFHSIRAPDEATDCNKPRPPPLRNRLTLTSGYAITSGRSEDRLSDSRMFNTATDDPWRSQ